MKKILSFLTKKPLALAAVALFSMSSFAQETGAPKEEGTTEATTPTQKIWAKLTDSSLLKPFLKVTLVDEVQGKIYTVGEDGYQKEAEDFVPGSDAEQNGSYLYVCEGKVARATADDEVFSLNTKDEGKGFYIDKRGAVQQRMLDADVSWLKDVSEGIFNEAEQDYFIYYDYDPESGEGEKIFKTTKSAFNPASLYFEKEVGLPVFDPEEGVQVNPGEGVSVTITNPNKNADGGEEGSLKWRFKGDEDWQDYEDAILLTERDEEITIEAKIVFDENVETKVVESTYLLTDIEAPEIEPEAGFDVEENGEIDDVTITSEDGTTLKYTITVGETTNEKTEPSNEATVNLIEYIGKTVTVSATANKTVTFKGEEVEVESDATTREYNIVAYPAPEEVEFMAYPAPESTVDLGTNIDLWFEVGQEGYGVEYDGTKDANKKLTLTFKDGDEVTVDVKEGEDGKVYITVPSDKQYANSEFTFDVPEGFYYTYTGGDKKANKVGTPEQKDVKYYTGLYPYDFIIDPETTFQPTDKNTLRVKVYPVDEPTAEVDLTDEALARQKENAEGELEADPGYGANFSGPQSEHITDILKVEKITTDDEGNPLPNTFEITFENEDGQADFIKYYLENEDFMINYGGYSLGFPIGTFKSGDQINKQEVNHHVKFVESVDLVVEPLDWSLCEGSRAMLVKVIATGKVERKDGKKSYNSTTGEDSPIVFDEEAVVTIKGTDIYGDEVDVEATIRVAPDESVHYVNGKYLNEVYELYYGTLNLDRDEDPLRDTGWTLREDNGMGADQNFAVTIPAGAFKCNPLDPDHPELGYSSETPEYTGVANVMAHPYWTADAQPYTYAKDSKGATTLIIDCTAELDDLLEDGEGKLFENDVHEYLNDQNKKTGVIKVDGEEVEEWKIVNVSAPYVEPFDYRADLNMWGYAKPLAGKDVPKESFQVELTLKTPITGSDDHTIAIGKQCFAVNGCANDPMEITVRPLVTYFIQQVKYVIPTSQDEVTYNICAQFPDGTILDEAIEYVGELDADARNIYNALRYNNATYVDVDETGTGIKVSDKNSFFPEVKSTVPVDAPLAEFVGEGAESLSDASPVDEEGNIKATEFTIAFPENTLVVNNYKMNFPAGTVQIKGYNANTARLYNPFDVVPAYAFDATSSEEDYNNPTNVPKKKEYNISTKTKEITLYLTAVNEDQGTNANANVLFIEGSPLLYFKGETTEETDGVEGVFNYKNVKDGKFTVTFNTEDGTLAPGRYTMIVPHETVTTKNVFALKGTQLNTKNPEAFFLTINVEDFAGPDDQPIEITTKTWEFDVPLSEGKVTEVDEDAEVWLVDDNGNGMPVELSKTDETTLHVTLTYDEEEEHYNFLHSTPFPPKSYVKGAGADADADAEEKGLYTLIIPAGAFTGEYATTYEDLTVKVKVIYEFVDSRTGLVDGMDNDLVTTEMEVNMETGDHEKMYFTRKLANQNYQPLAVPFDLTQEEVKDYFTIYRIETVTVHPAGDDVEYHLNFVPVGEEGTAYANKPYIIKAKEANAEPVQIALYDKEVQEPEVADDVKASTTKVRFDFINTLADEEQDAERSKFGFITGDDGKGYFTDPDDIWAWRWYMKASDKEVRYIKIYVNGVDVDATGIDFVEAAEGDNLIFNVAGQKLNTAAKGKVNIINGKKVLVK